MHVLECRINCTLTEGAVQLLATSRYGSNLFVLYTANFVCIMVTNINERCISNWYIYATAVVFIETLSAPQLSNLFISSTLLTPPPTVKGTKHFFDVFFTTS